MISLTGSACHCLFKTKEAALALKDENLSHSWIQINWFQAPEDTRCAAGTI